MKNKRKIDKFHCYEARDRCYCLHQIIESLLINHPVIAANKKWGKTIEEAQYLISEVYQEIGAICIPDAAQVSDKGEK